MATPEIFKSNISVKDFITLIVMLIPLLLAWDNLNAELKVQETKIKSMQDEMANHKMDVRENYNSMNAKLDKVLEQVSGIKIEMQNKKDRDKQ